MGINPQTVAKWRKRAMAEDLKIGPKASHSTTLTQAQEAAVVASQRNPSLPLDDCAYTLQPMIPQLTQLSLYRCIHRDGIYRLLNIEGDKP